MKNLCPEILPFKFLKMKTLKQTIPATCKFVWGLPAAFIFFTGLLLNNTASAQRPDRGNAERSNSVREHNPRQNNNDNRSSDFRRAERRPDMQASRDNNRSQNAMRPQRDYNPRPRQQDASSNQGFNRQNNNRGQNNPRPQRDYTPMHGANASQDVSAQNSYNNQNGQRPQRDYKPKPRQDANTANDNRNGNSAYNNTNNNNRRNRNDVNRNVTINNTTINRTNNNYYNGRDRHIYTSSRPGYTPIYRHDIRPVYNAYNPSWRYSCLPGRYSYYSSLPASYLTINFGGFGYRYWDGVFYRPYNNLFTVCAPPIGIFINVLPVGYRRIYVHNYPYFYYNGTYYDYRDNNYYVVSPPVGAIVESLPDGYETVVIDGETYYTIDGAQYKPKVMDNGEIWYEVVKSN